MGIKYKIGYYMDVASSAALVGTSALLSVESVILSVPHILRGDYHSSLAHGAIACIGGLVAALEYPTLRNTLQKRGDSEN